VAVALAATTLLAIAVAVRSSSSPVRVFAYAFYAIAVGLGFGGGVVFGFLNAVGGLQGKDPGPVWLTVLLGMGAAASVASLLGVAMLVRSDLLTDGPTRR